MKKYNDEISFSHICKVANQSDMSSLEESMGSQLSECEFYISEETAAAALLKKEGEIKERESLLNANRSWEMWADSVLNNGYSSCPTCATSSDEAYPPNKLIPWLGIGEDEHCRDCGAFAVRHSLGYRDISRRSMSKLVADIAAVEAVYGSPIFMTEEQTKKNRAYFSRLLNTAVEKDPSHEPGRYETRIFRRHRDALFDYLIDLATNLYGERKKAIEVYGDVSREFDHIYFFIDEVKKEIQAAR
jgi:hypothetical protein